MKKIYNLRFTIYAVLAFQLFSASAFAANVQFYFQNMVGAPEANRKVVLTPRSAPQYLGTNLITASRYSFTNSAGGAYLLTNAQYGTYEVRAAGTGGDTFAMILVPDDTNTYNAGDLLVTTIAASSSVSWSATASDARYLAQTNAGGLNGTNVWIGPTNRFPNVVTATNTSNTFAGSFVGEVTGSTNLVTKNGTNVFTGTNTFSGRTIITNPASVFNGTGTNNAFNTATFSGVTTFPSSTTIDASGEIDTEAINSVGGIGFLKSLGVSSVDWGGRTLDDETGAQFVIWTNRRLTVSGGGSFSDGLTNDSAQGFVGNIGNATNLPASGLTSTVLKSLATNNASTLTNIPATALTSSTLISLSTNDAAALTNLNAARLTGTVPLTILATNAPVAPPQTGARGQVLLSNGTSNYWAWNGLYYAAWLNIGVTNTAAETAIVAINMPPLGSNAQVRIEYFINGIANHITNTINFYYGATLAAQHAAATSPYRSTRDVRTIENRNSVAATIAYGQSSAYEYATSTSLAPLTTTFNTSTNFVLTMKIQNSTTGQTNWVEALKVFIWDAPGN